MKILQSLICIGLCLVLVLADHKRESKSIHEAKKQYHRDSKAAHRDLLAKIHSKHEAHGVRKHAPEFVSPHDAHMQADLGYKKPKRGHGIARDDINLQTLEIEAPRAHKIQEHKTLHNNNNNNRKHEINTKDRFVVPNANLHHRNAKLDPKRVKDDIFKGKTEKGHKKRGDKKGLYPKKKMYYHKTSANKH